MNYTPHYQLPQWVETDRIMMDDFNDMTQKIDSGLSNIDTQLANLPIVKLAEETLTAAANSLDLDLSAVDLTQYSELRFLIRGGVSTVDTALHLRLNNNAAESYDAGAAGSSSNVTSTSWSLYSRFNTNAVCEGTLLPTGTAGRAGAYWYAAGLINNYIAPVFCGGLHRTMLFTNISKLHFFPEEGNLIQGTTAAVYGMRK